MCRIGKADRDHELLGLAHDLDDRVAVEGVRGLKRRALRRVGRRATLRHDHLAAFGEPRVVRA